MSARRTAVALLLGLVGPALLVPTSGAAPVEVVRRSDTPRVVDPGRLARGPDAAVDHLQDGVIQTRSGRRIRVRVPSTRDRQALLGRSGNSWIVAWGDSRDRYDVAAIRRGQAPRRIPRQRQVAYANDSWVGWRLSRDGSALVSTMFDRGGSTRSVRDLEGKGFGWDYTGDYTLPMDVDAGRVVVLTEDHASRARVIDWTLGGDRVTVAKQASGASIAHDVLFVRTARNSYGPTALSAPGVPAWSAPLIPLDFSPNGRRVLGLRTSSSGFDFPAILDVRRMSDGRLLDSIAFGPRITQANWSISSSHEQTARWETDQTFVFQLRSRRGAVLVRCDLKRACERASDYGGNISTPYEEFVWP